MKKKQLREALAVLLTKLSSARDNPWIDMMMKSVGGDTSIKESMTDEAIEGMVNSMLGE